MKIAMIAAAVLLGATLILSDEAIAGAREVEVVCPGFFDDDFDFDDVVVVRGGPFSPFCFIIIEEEDDRDFDRRPFFDRDRDFDRRPFFVRDRDRDFDRRPFFRDRD
jgi:hypothetical protein